VGTHVLTAVQLQAKRAGLVKTSPARSLLPARFAVFPAFFLLTTISTIFLENPED
jgi:hypothetical protein